MIDAMCHDCRFFFGSLLGWKCSKDTQGIEHDPTDKACDKFQRKVMPFVRQEIPIQVQLTGRISRWSPPTDCKGNGTGDIASVEVEPQAPCYHTRAVWLSVDKLMWGEWDGEPIQQEELEQICRYETDVRELMVALVSSGVTPFGMMMVISQGVVDAASEIGVPIRPTDLLAVIVASGRRGDLITGVSAHAIAKDLAASGTLAKWGVVGFAKPKE